MFDRTGLERGCLMDSGNIFSLSSSNSIAIFIFIKLSISSEISKL